MTLDAYLDGWRARPFDWHDANCAHFVAGWAQLHTPKAGGLQAAPLRALVRLKHWKGGVVAAVSAVLDTPPGRVADACTGDIAAVPLARHRVALGIVNGARVMILARPAGLDFVPLSFAAAVWRLPR